LVIGLFGGDYHPTGNREGRSVPFLQFWEVVSVHVSPFFLNFKQVGLLFLIIDFALSFPLAEIFKRILDILSLFLKGHNAANQIVVDVLLNASILPLFYFFNSLNLLHVGVDLTVYGRYLVL
jgi:hypothetical protein